VEKGRIKIPADGSAVRINRAEHPAADFSGQAVASGLGLVGAFHDQMEIIELLGHFNGDAPRGDFIGFGPVKGGPEKRAAGAAFHAGIDGHFFNAYLRLTPITMDLQKKADDIYTPAYRVSRKISKCFTGNINHIH